MFWWMENEVYWNNFGCEKNNGGTWTFEKPCAPHAICSWLENVNDRKPFCPAATDYRKPGSA